MQNCSIGCRDPGVKPLAPLPDDLANALVLWIGAVLQNAVNAGLAEDEPIAEVHVCTDDGEVA